jgi:hypothetical protein
MRAFLLGVAVLALGACATDSDPSTPDPIPDPDPDPDPVPTDDEARDYDDIAATIGATSAMGELRAMIDASMLAEGVVPADLTYIGVDGTFTHHARGTRAGVTFDYFYHCNDDADVIVPSCSGNDNHAHIAVQWAGDASSDTMAMEAIAREGDWTIRDMRADKPRVGGDGEISFVARSSDSVYNLSYAATFDRVRFLPGSSMPASGGIVFAIAAERTRNEVVRNFAVNAGLVFAGATTATLVLDGTHPYSLDLSTGVTTKL